MAKEGPELRGVSRVPEMPRSNHPRTPSDQGICLDEEVERLDTSSRSEAASVIQGALRRHHGSGGGGSASAEARAIEIAGA